MHKSNKPAEPKNTGVWFSQSKLSAGSMYAVDGRLRDRAQYGSVPNLSSGTMDKARIQELFLLLYDFSE